MKKVLLFLSAFLYMNLFSQISQRCATCPPNPTGHAGEVLGNDGHVVEWVTGGSAGNTIYTGDGSLTSHRTVSQGAYQLNFTGNNDTYFAIRPSDKFISLYTNDGDDGFQINPNANQTYWAVGGQYMFYNNGTSTCLNPFSGQNVGIGTLSPSQLLTVGNGDPVTSLPGILCAVGSNSYISADNGTINTFMGSDGSGTGIIGTETNHDLVIRTNNTDAIHITSNGQILIGTSTPVGKNLYVAGSLKTYTFQVDAGSGTVGNVLTDDGSGNATWGVGGWKLTGNSGTISPTNFIGTTDTPSLLFKVGQFMGGLIDSASNNTFFGGGAGQGYLDGSLTGQANSAFGLGSLYSLTSGYTNTAIGLNNLQSNTTGHHNVTVGTSNFETIDTGCHNIGIGTNNQANNPDDSSIIAIGCDMNLHTGVIAFGRELTSDAPNTIIFQSKDSLRMPLVGSSTAGNILRVGASGYARWTNLFSTPIKDSIAATGATISLAINSSHIITSVGAITSATISFPSGNTGDWIVVVFNKAIATLTNSGTGGGTVGLVAPLLGTSKTYLNIGGNWY